MKGPGSRIVGCAGAALALTVLPLGAQEPHRPDGGRAPWGAEFLIPFGSLIVPGLGQYLRGDVLPGLGFSAAAVAGAVVAGMGNPNTVAVGELPRDGQDQIANQGAHVSVTAGALSLYDAFRAAVPALQREGKYDFLATDERIGDLLWAPVDPRFLTRWTTWIELAYTAGVVGLVLSQRDDGVAYERYHGRDAAFITSLSLNAGVGEEALFRGWLFPLFHQNFGRRFWLANALQAGIFGGAHVPQAEEFAIAITAWALYEGWLVRRNDWSIRESIFHHFWYDIFVGTATLLVDEVNGQLRLTLPPVRF